MKHTKLALLAPIALAAACFSQASAAACPTTTKTLTSGGPFNTVKTGLDIQAQIDALVKNGGGILALSGQFKVSKPIIIGSCVSLQTAALSSKAQLVWDGGTTVGYMLQAGGVELTGGALTQVHDVKISNIKVTGRGIWVHSVATGIANQTIEKVDIADTTMSDPLREGFNHMIKITGGNTWRLVGNTFTISDAHAELRKMSTGIMAYNMVNVTIQGNTFTGVGSGMHFKGLQDAVIGSSPGATATQIDQQRNTGSRYSWAAIEMQEDDSLVQNKNVRIADNVFTDWIETPSGPNPTDPLNFYFGLSLANGTNTQLINNKIFARSGASLDTCLRANNDLRNVSWAVEFSGNNAVAKGNLICGFNDGIVIGTWDPASTGLDRTTVDNNQLSNLNGSAITLAGWAGQKCLQGCDPGQTPVYEEAALAEKRWADQMAVLNRQVLISNNVIKKARYFGIASAGGLIGGNNTLVRHANGTIDTNDLRVPVSYASYLRGLTIQGNQISRSYLDFPEDATRTDPHGFVGIALPPISQPVPGVNAAGQRDGTGLSISGNTIAWAGASSTGLYFRGIELGFVLQPDNGQNYSRTTFQGSRVEGTNTIKNTSPSFGQGIYGRDPHYPFVPPAVLNGLVVTQTNTFSGLGMNVGGDSVVCTVVNETVACH